LCLRGFWSSPFSFRLFKAGQCHGWVCPLLPASLVCRSSVWLFMFDI
jgi:hypothetical protein